MRYVTIPDPIQLKHPRTKEDLPGDPKTFLDYAHDLWFNDPRVSESGPMKLRRWMKMVDKFEKFNKPGDVVVLDDTDWDRLKSIINEPKLVLPPLTMAQLLPFAIAVLDAPDEDPRPKTEEAEPAKE